VERLGYPERFCSVGTSVVATWTFETGCMYDCGSIRLDQVSSAWQVVEFVGTSGDVLRMSWSEEVRLGVFCNSVGEVVRSERVSVVWDVHVATTDVPTLQKRSGYPKRST